MSSRSAVLLSTAVGVIALLAGGLVLLAPWKTRPESSVAPAASTQVPSLAEPDPVPQAAPPKPAAPERGQVSAPVSALPRGRVVVVIAAPLPESAQRIELWVHAWRSHAGAAREVVQHTEVPAGTGRAEFSLPGGSFALHARANGRVSAVRRVDLDVRRPNAEVELELVPARALHGVVLSHDGLPAVDLPLHFIDGSGQWLASTASDPRGLYRFEGLPPVAGLVLVGALAGPLTSPLDVDLGQGDERAPDVALSPMGAVQIEVRDEFGAIVPALALSGVSDSSVRLELETDAWGIAASTFVPPGLWRVFADAGPLGRGNVACEVAAGAPTTVTLGLRR